MFVVRCHNCGAEYRATKKVKTCKYCHSKRVEVIQEQQAPLTSGASDTSENIKEKIIEQIEERVERDREEQDKELEIRKLMQDIWKKYFKTLATDEIHAIVQIGKYVWYRFGAMFPHKTHSERLEAIKGYLEDINRFYETYRDLANRYHELENKYQKFLEIFDKILDEHVSLLELIYQLKQLRDAYPLLFDSDSALDLLFEKVGGELVERKQESKA